MKKSLIKTILLISMVLGYSSSWATNIIVNPIFEDGDLSPWYGWDITSADAHSALHSATVLGRFDKIRQDFSPILTDSINEISFWMRQPETAMSTITLFFADNSTTADVSHDHRHSRWLAYSPIRAFHTYCPLRGCHSLTK
jgi:hypothetical protein